MKQLTVRSRVLCAVATAALFVGGAFAQGEDHSKHAGHHGSAAQADQTKTEFIGKGDGVETCPVTGEAITSKDAKAEFFGRTVYVCCEGCLAELKKSPAAYLKPTLEEQRAALKAAQAAAKPEGHDHPAQDADKKDGAKFLGKGDGIKTCPVTGEEVSKDVKAVINGRTVYFCCEDCVETVKKNPDLYLKKAENQ